MGLSKLAKLYDEHVEDLYRIKPTTFNTGEPYYYNKLKRGPMDESIKYDSRSLPITSTLRDIERLTKFSTSGKGMLFLAEQQLLQTGNYFAYTSVINPLFVEGNIPPFLHLTRSLRGSPILEIPDAVKGRLQKSTGKVALSNAAAITSAGSKQRATNGKGNTGVLGGLINGVLGTLSNIAGTIDPNATVYEENTRPDQDNFDTMQNNSDLNPPTSAGGSIKPTSKNVLDIPSLMSKYSTYTPDSVAVEPQRKYNTSINGEIISYAGFVDRIKSSYPTKLLPGSGSLKAISYFNDQEMNGPDSFQSLSPMQTTLDSDNNPAIKDYIKVCVKIPSQKTSVQFRAFISDVKQILKSDFNQVTYIGRTEKYTTYGGASRTVRFTLKLHAYSSEEMDGIHLKVNHLTGLAYPLGVTLAKGPTQPQMLQPPLVTLTIGNIYNDQPGYFDNLDIQFGDMYDLDKEIPYTVTINAVYNIIEKQIMFYDSPFYGIVEKNNQYIHAITLNRTRTWVSALMPKVISPPTDPPSPRAPIAPITVTP